MARKNKEKNENNNESINDIYLAIQVYKNAIRPGRNPIGTLENIRNNDLFLHGYKQDNAINVPGYTANFSMKKLVDLFNNLTNLQQKGALAWEIEHRALKLSFRPNSERFSQLFRSVVNTIKPDELIPYSSQQLAPQGLLLNLSNDGFGGRCDPLSKLVLVAKQLENDGQKGVAHALLEKLFYVATIINNPEYYSDNEKSNANSLINRLKEINNYTIQSSHYMSYESILNNIVKNCWSRSTNNEITLQQMLDKLIPQNRSAAQLPVLFELETPIHAMAAWSKIEDNQRIYGFYDPNVGIVEFSSFVKFKNYMVRFFGKPGLNMAKEYQLTHNPGEGFTFTKVIEFNGHQLLNVKPDKELFIHTTLKHIVLLPIVEQSGLPRETYPIYSRDSFADHSQFNVLDTIMFSKDLSKSSPIFWQSKNYLYKEIITYLDNVHNLSGVDKVDHAFILKNKIHDFINKYPYSDHYSSLLLLNTQIDDALFNADLDIAKFAINQIATTRPILASKLYQIAYKEAQGEQPGLTDLMLRWVNEDPYFQPLRGFSGNFYDKNILGFDPKFHISFGDEYDNFKYHLLQAQQQDILTKCYLDDLNRTVTLGYTYQELHDLTSNKHANMAVYLIKEAARNIRDKGVVKQIEEIMLDKFANIDYLRHLQDRRLIQIEKIYHSNHNTNIDSWDNNYSGTAYEELEKHLNQQHNINGMLAILLEENKGLLISENHATELHGQKFIINYIDILKEHGVTTIGLEHLRRDLAQPLIDDYLQSGKMKGDLQAIVKTKSLESLFALAYEKGMKILALDDNSTATIKPVSQHGLMYRAGAANNVAVEILNQVPADEKFIVIYGRAHLMPHQGIDSFLPGINMRMGLPSLYVGSDDRLHIEKDDRSQRKIYDDIVNSPRIFFNSHAIKSPRPVPLIKRIKQTLAILDDLMSHKLKINKLSEHHRRVLKDFFHTPEKNFDTKKLLITLTNSNLYLQFTAELRYLMQASGTHHQLRNYSGQDALQRSNQWNTILAESGALLNQVAQKNTRSSIKIKLTFTPQGLYIGDGSRVANQNATNLGLAYLYSLSQGTDVNIQLLTGFYTHADINERKIEGGISIVEEKQAEEFSQILNSLRQIAYDDASLFQYQGNYSLDEWLQQIDKESNGYYQLKADKHVLTLATKYIDNQFVFYLYDPNIGEINFSSDNQDDVIDALKSTIQDYLHNKNSAWNNLSLAEHYGIQKEGNKFEFNFYKLNVIAANNNPSLIQLKQLLENSFINEVQRMKQAGNAKFGNIILPWQTLYEMGATTADGYRISADSDINNKPLFFNSVMLIPWLIAETTSPEQIEHAINVLKQSTNVDRQTMILTNDPYQVAATKRLLQLLDNQDDNSKIKNILIDTVNLTQHQHWISRATNIAGRVNQSGEYIKTLQSLFDYWRRRNIENLNAEQKKALDVDAGIAAAGLAWNMGSEIAEYGFNKLGKHLASQTAKRVAQGLPLFQSRLSGIAYKWGIKIAQWGNSVLSVLGSAFDIYSAGRSFSALASETNPKIRTDLVVSGALATAGATTGIFTAVALGIGGKIASIGGPLGIAIGILLGMSSGIYFAARQVAYLKENITLTSMQILRSGWQAFWRMDLDIDIANAVVKNQTLQQARKEYHDLLEKNAKAFAEKNGIQLFYYSAEPIRLQEYFYKSLTFAYSNLIYFYRKNNIFIDKIKPEDVKKQLNYFIKHSFLSKKNNHNLLTDIRLEDSQYKFYSPVGFESTNDYINANGQNESNIKTLLFNPHKMIGKLIKNITTDFYLQLNIFRTYYQWLIGDFNGDSHHDIGYLFQKNIFILFCDKNGIYNDPILLWNFTDLANPRCFVVDINYDGQDEIIVVDIDSEGILLITFKKNSELQFLITKQRLSLKEENDFRNNGMVFGDIDGDQYVDLVYFNNHNIHIYYGIQNGKFSEEIIFINNLFDITDGIVKYIMDDINRDGCADIIILTTQGEIYSLFGQSDRLQKYTLDARENYSVTKISPDHIGVMKDINPAQIQFDDFDGDGCFDLVIINNNGTFTVFYGEIKGTFSLIRQEFSSEKNNADLTYCTNDQASDGAHAIIGITQNNKGKQALLSVNQSGEINTHFWPEPQPADTTAWFRLGNGDDIVIGHQDRKNIFEIGGGRKQFTGGIYSDKFLLMGQSAPEIASIFDGGMDPESQNAERYNQNIIIAAAKPLNENGYDINLKEGIARYRDNNKLIATLSNISHAQGHPETNDILIGNDADNYLNGAGGTDIIFGYNGDDVITLSAGFADGEKGNDSYHIKQNISNEDVQIIVYEENTLQEKSYFWLDYQVEQIEFMQLENDDIIFTLRNNNQTLTTLRLKELYQLSYYLTEKELTYAPTLYTRDGFMINGWLNLLNQDKKDHWPAPTLLAQYQPELDQYLSTRFSNKTPKEIDIHLQRRDEQGYGRITIGNTIIILPKFLQLATMETLFNDRIEGDSGDNLLSSFRGNDILAGKGGKDYYIIYDLQNADKEIRIDNNDSNIDLEDESSVIDQDVMLLPWSIEQFTIDKSNDDLVISHRSEPEQHAKVRILYFFRDKSQRHLSLMDKNGGFYELDINREGSTLLGQIEISDSDDYIELHDVISASSSPNSLNAGKGDDIIIDKSTKGTTLHGGDGNDILLAMAGKNKLYGNEGDDQLYGGTDNDSLSGGYGNDELFAGAGNDKLMGGYGDDTLHGDEGDDSLFSGFGNNILIGGKGKDIFWSAKTTFDSFIINNDDDKILPTIHPNLNSNNLYMYAQGDGEDYIIEQGSGTDKLKFTSHNITPATLWLQKIENNLLIKINGLNSGDSITLVDYYLSSDNKIETLETTDFYLSTHHLELLAEMMSTLAPFDFVTPLSDGNNLQTYINNFWLAVPT